ncbi:MAG: glycosyl hydrolase [Verrucomicrobia bacterium]|nr:glycosyl hydrolase [Verrucomicrobiota bacterium]
MITQHIRKFNAVAWRPLLALAGLLSTTVLAVPCKADMKADFVNPPLKSRARPLWFWNNTDVTAAGVEAQLQDHRDRSGYGGMAPLPFGAKFTPKYLSAEYFELYGAAVNKARDLGMFLTIYDEYGFPSGSCGANMGDGIPRFKQQHPNATLRRLDKHEDALTGPAAYTKALPAGTLMSLVAMNTATLERVDLTEMVKDGSITWSVPAGTWKIMTFVCVLDGDPNVDYLEPRQVEKFISMVYQPYHDRFGKDFGATIAGAFYDEPTLYRAQGRTWTDRFNERFQAAHGFSPTPYYPALWYDIGPETQAARNHLFGFRSELFASGYMKTVQDWCSAHGGIPLLGHQDQENVKNPVGVSGDLMKSYRYQDVPGVDKIGWDNDPEGYYKLVSSVVYNWDKVQAMTETYGAMGNLSWDRLYAVVMEQYAKGINNIVPHGVWYDPGKVTYLPELSSRNPRYADGLAAYNTYVGRLNVLLQQPGRHVADIAVLYPIATLQAGYRFDGPLSPYSGGVNVPEADYIYLGELLATKVCRDFTFLHPEVLDQRCTVQGALLKLNNKLNHEDYQVVILPGHRTISWSNLQQLKKFYDAGGKVLATGQLPSKSAEFGHDADVVATIKAMFPGVTHQILATASSEWRESGAYEAAKAIDGAPDTRWAPSDEQASNWWLEVDFGTAQTFNSTRINEAIERVTSYQVEAWNGSAWTRCTAGTTLGANKVDKFTAVTASRVRLLIGSVAAATPSIAEFEVRLDDGPNLAHSDALVVQDGGHGGRTIYLNSPNETNLRQALDQALKVYDVEIESKPQLRYIHKVAGDTEIFFVANPDAKEAAAATIRMRGKFTPETWDPHSGEIAVPEFTHTLEDGQPVTTVRLTLGPVRSQFIISKNLMTDRTMVRPQ